MKALDQGFECPKDTSTDSDHTHSLERMRADGAVVLSQVVSPSLVHVLRAAFLDRCRQYLQVDAHSDALEVGDKRFMITPDFEPPFSDPAVYAPPAVLHLVRALLAEDCVLGSFGAVISLPEAADQHIHRDFPGLFPGTGLDVILPAYAITMVMPLVDVDEVTGTTIYWAGSHRQRVNPSDCEPGGAIWPSMKVGDCMLMDYRLVHSGSANRSDQPRPILYNVYCRPWFRDHVNYARQPRIAVTSSVLEQVPLQYRSLFAL